MPRGAVSGEIIAGIEPIANTIAGIERITARRRIPDRLHLPSDDRLRHGGLPPPDYEDMRR